MKKFYKGILAAVLACCVMFSLAACGGDPAPANSDGGNQNTTSLSRYDYVADMKGNTVNMTIAQNLKSVTIEIKSMNLDLTAYCTVEDNILTLTELAEGNEQFYAGLSATPYLLSEDGTATPVSDSEGEGKEESAGLSRYDYVADMKGNTVNMTIAQNLKSVTIEIKSMNLDLTAFCTVEGNILTLTELAEGNEQFYNGLAATPYVLNEDGTATPQS